jgi:hypothetical protein
MPPSPLEVPVLVFVTELKSASSGAVPSLRFVKRLVSKWPSPFQGQAIDATIPFMGDSDVVQAMELIRALRDATDEMTRRLTLLESCNAQLEAAALRQDINEAQTHINRLQRRYLNGDKHARPRRLAKQAT